MADKDEIKKRILEDADYIRSPKFSNSLAKFMSKHPDGIEDTDRQDAMIARLLSMTEEEVQQVYEEAVKLLREEMVEDESG